MEIKKILNDFIAFDIIFLVYSGIHESQRY